MKRAGPIAITMLVLTSTGCWWAGEDEGPTESTAADIQSDEEEIDDLGDLRSVPDEPITPSPALESPAEPEVAAPVRSHVRPAPSQPRDPPRRPARTERRENRHSAGEESSGATGPLKESRALHRDSESEEHREDRDELEGDEARHDEPGHPVRTPRREVGLAGRDGEGESEEPRIDHHDSEERESAQDVDRGDAFADGQW